MEAAAAPFPAPLEFFYTLAAHNETLRQRLARFYANYHEKLCLLLQEWIAAHRENGPGQFLSLFQW